MKPKLEGRVALVSGAGRGIGRAIAHKLACEGASIVVNDMDEDVAQACAQEIRTAGGQAVACAGSVTQDGFADRFVGAALQTYGDLHIVVNNAGYTWDAVIHKMSDAQWDDILAVHLTAPFRILRAAAGPIREAAKAEQERGERITRKVVNISSLTGVGGNAGQANYAAAKAGVNGLTGAMAKEWGRYNVTVNSVAFGLINTRLTEVTAGGDASIRIGERDIKVGINAQVLEGMEKGIPLGRAGTPQDAAGAVYLLCIPESDYVSGQVLLCAGGYMV